MSERLELVRSQIEKKCKAVERAPGEVTLVAVSKTFAAEDITPLLAAGQRVFGENRVQEAKAKWPALKAEFPDVELHLIGPLQTNKVREAAALFDVIESVDRPKLAAALAKEMAALQRQLPVFLQVNTGEEPQKAGVAPQEVSGFVRLCRDELMLNVAGLMAIPPADEPPAPHFALLDELAAREGLSGRSMGMSADFEIAISQGATHIRVGSALFGHRDYAG